MLCGFKISMAKHFTYGFNWYSIAQCYRRSKCVPRYMKSKIKMNAATISDFL